MLLNRLVSLILIGSLLILQCNSENEADTPEILQQHIPDDLCHSSTEEIQIESDDERYLKQELLYSKQ